MKESTTVVVKEFNMGNAFRKVIAGIRGGCDLVYVIITFLYSRLQQRGKLNWMVSGIRYIFYGKV
jgi:hypothetical protein